MPKTNTNSTFWNNSYRQYIHSYSNIMMLCLGCNTLFSRPNYTLKHNTCNPKYSIINNRYLYWRILRPSSISRSSRLLVIRNTTLPIHMNSSYCLTKRKICRSSLSYYCISLFKYVMNTYSWMNYTLSRTTISTLSLIKTKLLMINFNNLISKEFKNKLNKMNCIKSFLRKPIFKIKNMNKK